jgi:radical SAM superfamily enzyme YgiQ (UPF0313 family)
MQNFQPHPLNILLVLPNGRIHKLTLGPLNISFREAPLTATTLAALVPSEINVRVTIADESVQSIPFQNRYDLVGISCITGTSTRAYAIADRFRAQGATVVLGGVHVTLMPEEAAQHADAIVIGFAEDTWGELLRDFVHKRLKSVYRSEITHLEHIPHARRDLQKQFGYMVPNTVFATRGCKGTCDFCTIPAANFGWHTRPIAEVIAEIRTIKAKRFTFNDVNLTEDTEYAKELFRAMIPLKKLWGGLSSTRIAPDEELLQLMHQSGCRYLLIGFESLDNSSLTSIHKGFNKAEEYQALVYKLHDLDIVIQGCFIFGFDEDDHTVFARTVDLVNQLKIDIPRYAIYTPYPGTEAFERLQREQRLLHYDWQYYDTQHVVFQPKNMSPQELDEGFKWAYKQTFTVSSSLQRTWGSGANFLITFIGNLAYKLYVNRLYAEKQRFPEGILTTKNTKKHEEKDRKEEKWKKIYCTRKKYITS